MENCSRNCSNCIDCHHYKFQDEEILKCENNPFSIEEVNNNYVCDNHRFAFNYSQEVNELFYDDSYGGPGFLIITKRNNEIIKYLKLFIINPKGVPKFGINAYDSEETDLDDDFTTLSFVFRDIEDNANGLYSAFLEFCESINKDKTHFNVVDNGNTVKLVIAKAKNYKQSSMDINLGDYFSSRCYPEVFNLFMNLIKYKTQTLSEEDTKQIVRERTR